MSHATVVRACWHITIMFIALDDAPPAAVIANTDEFIDWQLQGLGIEDAWKKTKGDGALVGVLDTGTVDHPNLNPNVVERVGQPDMAGHGTHVTGIIAAAEIPNGICGVAPHAKVMSIQALPGDGSTIAAAIDKAVSLGCTVINMSLGGYEDDPTLHAAVKRAFAAGVILVAAGGNDHPTQTAYPARYQEVIAVSSIDSSSHEAWFAPNLADILSPNHFAMPGVQIVSTWLNGQYARLSGTSMSSPVMAGMVALILSIHKPAPSQAQKIINDELVRISKSIPGTTFREPEGSLL